MDKTLQSLWQQWIKNQKRIIVEQYTGIKDKRIAKVEGIACTHPGGEGVTKDLLLLQKAESSFAWVYPDTVISITDKETGALLYAPP